MGEPPEKGEGEDKISSLFGTVLGWYQAAPAVQLAWCYRI